MRAILVARRSAIKARTQGLWGNDPQAVNQLRGLLVSAPQALREAVLKPKTEECIRHCAQLDSDNASPQQVGLYRALRLLAERWEHLSAELQQLDQALEQLVKATAPQLIKQYGVGFYCAATLLVAAGDNPERMHSEAAFAALCGASPLAASSGKVKRHRLNRGGDRQANNALWTIAMVRAQ